MGGSAQPLRRCRRDDRPELTKNFRLIVGQVPLDLSIADKLREISDTSNWFEPWRSPIRQVDLEGIYFGTGEQSFIGLAVGVALP